jgi:hypothetical protein
LTGEKYSRQNNIPRKTSYFKRILFSFPRKSADPRPIPIPENAKKLDEQAAHLQYKKTTTKQNKKKTKTHNDILCVNVYNLSV